VTRDFFAALAAAFVVLAAPAVAADYPIHYDGPLVRHGVPAFRPDGLPSFDVTYHGGPIQPSTTSYTIFWRPNGTYMSPPYVQLLDRYLADAGGSGIYGMATVYYGSNGHVKNRSAFGGTWTDTSAYPKRLDSRALTREIAKAIAANNWPAGLRSQFFLFTARGAIKHIGYCAYHSYFNLDGNTKEPVIYGFIPYTGGLNGCDPPYGISPNNDVDSDGSIESVEHEQMEAVTDPLLNAWYDPHWGEIGDICIYGYGVPYGPGTANAVLNEHPYFLQELWSQPLQGCQPSL
jgi:hypothetical protein